MQPCDTDLRRARRMMRVRAVCAAAAAAVFLGGTGFALTFVWAPAGATLEAEAAPLKSRCPGCGWIESRRELVQADGMRVYEYTLRMSDGSSRTFSEALPPRPLRERVTLIDGTGE